MSLKSIGNNIDTYGNQVCSHRFLARIFISTVHKDESMFGQFGIRMYRSH